MVDGRVLVDLVVIAAVEVLELDVVVGAADDVTVDEVVDTVDDDVTADGVVSAVVSVVGMAAVPAINMTTAAGATTPHRRLAGVSEVLS